MYGRRILLTLLSISLMPSGEPARILGVFTLYARSHHRFIHPLMASLAEAGHEVVVYSYFPHENPPANYKDVGLGVLPKMDTMVNELILETLRQPHWKNSDALLDLAPTFLDAFLTNKYIQELLHSKDHFDLVVSESFAVQEFILILGHIFNAPTIAIQSFVTHKVLNRNAGNAWSLSYIPDLSVGFSSRMNLLERMQNTLFSLRRLWYVYDFKYKSLVDSTLKHHFPGSPPIQDLIANVSLVFVNDHLTADYAQPRTPNIIPVAGIHIENPKPLPENIQQFMDDAKQGVIYFSLGTYVPDNLRPKDYFSMFSQVFREIPQKVIWKTRKEDIKDLQDNVRISHWAPQQDILAHPNCVLFITHGGLLSTHETVHNGVPVVVIPHVFDQHRNSKFIEEKGIGIRLDLNNLTYQGIHSAIKEVLFDKRYKNNMLTLSKVFQDRPMSPRDTVVYWTEYVLKHGATHLRPASTHLAWYQLALLDVLAVVLLSLVIVLTMLYFTFKVCLIIVFRRKLTKKKKTT